MKKYHAKFQRDFEVDVEADDLQTAEMLGKLIIAQFPADTCKLLSIYAEGYVAPPPEEVKPIVQLSDAARAAIVRQEMKRPRYPGGIDDLVS